MSIVRRWLEQLAAALKLRRPRWIGILVTATRKISQPPRRLRSGFILAAMTW
jgi:hypothetical protein